ncbi:imidazolonepropionase [Xenorhabdus bovienii]|uniref:Imidazolonepropionase n=1 Tax=Xenorhabdus bovienii str. feltiae Moldova TaxID=1398200 RepID=A0A077NP22_XENBV|nr:imidazolonepropionase [Xenorhabdus bovienii]CDH00645.1 Imidazolonepropionase (Imidazolone-5-propionate hydrolase) [Xenorhabdus bovienii str. feltiae Moldova]
MSIELKDTDVIWRNARLATMNPTINNIDGKHHYGMLEQHDLIVRGEKILAIVPTDSVPTHHCHIIDVEQRLITPGLIDCHTHLVFGGNRASEWEQRLNGASYEEISAKGGGINSTVNATRNNSAQQLEVAAQKRLNALIAEGITTIEMKSGYGLDLVNEEKQLNVVQALAQKNAIEISPTLLSAHAVPPEYKHNPDAYIDLICDSILPTLWQKQLFESVDVFCETVGFNLDQTKRVFDAAQRLNIPVKGHVEQLSNMGGSELVADYQGWSVDHIEYLDEKGIEAISRSGSVAVLLPGAFYFLKEKKLPPISLLRQYRVPMAISTDFNPGTSPFASLRLIMNMACVQFGFTPEEAWQGVTLHAARALGRAESHGQLAEGYMADFIVWDAENPVDILYELGRNPLVHRIYRGEITHNFQ